MDLDGCLERTASGDGLVVTVVGKAAGQAARRAANDSLHDARARLKISSQ